MDGDAAAEHPYTAATAAAAGGGRAGCRRAALHSPGMGFAALFAVLSAGNSRFTSLFLRERGLDDAQVGAVLGLSSLSFLAVPVVAGLADRTAARAPVLAALTLLAVCVVSESVSSAGCLGAGRRASRSVMHLPRQLFAQFWKPTSAG